MTALFFLITVTNHLLLELQSLSKYFCGQLYCCISLWTDEKWKNLWSDWPWKRCILIPIRSPKYWSVATLLKFIALFGNMGYHIWGGTLVLLPMDFISLLWREPSAVADPHDLPFFPTLSFFSLFAQSPIYQHGSFSTLRHCFMPHLCNQMLALVQIRKNATTRGETAFFDWSNRQSAYDTVRSRASLQKAWWMLTCICSQFLTKNLFSESETYYLQKRIKYPFCPTFFLDSQ